MSFWPLFSTMRRRSSFLIRPATTCGDSGWCTTSGSCNQNLGTAYGCSGTTIASGWSGYNCPHPNNCTANRDACKAACEAVGVGATCYAGACNGACPSCRCTDGVRYTHGSWSGYDFASNCS